MTMDYFRDFVPKTITLPNPDPFGRAQNKIVPATGVVYVGPRIISGTEVGLRRGDNLFSATRAFVFGMAAYDGDLTLSVYDDASQQYRQILSFGTAGASDLFMQDDGNLVAYNPLGRVLWDSASRWNYNLRQQAFFRCQDDGNLVVYVFNGPALGYSGTFAGGRTDPIGPGGWGRVWGAGGAGGGGTGHRGGDGTGADSGGADSAGGADVAFPGRIEPSH
jgi:hypothetical protein